MAVLKQDFKTAIFDAAVEGDNAVSFYIARFLDLSKKA